MHVTAGPTLARWALYGAVSILIGAASFHWVVLTGSVSPDPMRKAAIRRTVAGWALLSAVVLSAALAAVLYFQLEDFRDPFEPVRAELSLLLVGTLWGRIWIVQALITLVALPVVGWARRHPGGSSPWMAVTLIALASGVMPALSGHSFGAERYRALVITADALHVWGAGAWLGTLFVMLIAARRHLYGTTELLGTLAGWVRLFSPLAIGSVALLIVSGVFATWVHLGSWSALVSHGYGRVLLLKIVIFAGVGALGAYNWKRVTPELSTESGQRTFVKRSAPGELVLGATVLLLTAILIATSPPVDSP